MHYLIGIDEVGRGPLAGPVAVCALMMLTEKNDWKFWEGLRDSKKLSAKKREKWFARIKELKQSGELDFRVEYESASAIDEIGISKAIRKCIYRALSVCAREHLAHTHILLDGGLKAPEEFSQKTIIKGDEKEPIIALASIVAKVSRDRLMTDIAKKYPEYGFEKHKGYGTKFHFEMIKKYGVSPEHRKTFLGGVFNQ